MSLNCQSCAQDLRSTPADVVVEAILGIGTGATVRGRTHLCHDCHEALMAMGHAQPL